MNRVNVHDGDHRIGHFDWDKIRARWSDGDRNGYGNGSRGTGRGTALILTSGGKWVLEHWTQWQGEADSYSYASDEAAREWMLVNGFDDAATEHFGDIPEEEDKRSGRPAIGGAVHVRLGDLVARVDEFAARRGGLSRADAVRELIRAGLTTAGTTGEES